MTDIYKSTTTSTTSTDNDNIINSNSFFNFFPTIKNAITHKPLKKCYRILILGLLAVVVNNTSNVNVIDIFSSIIKQNICNSTDDNTILENLL